LNLFDLKKKKNSINSLNSYFEQKKNKLYNKIKIIDIEIKILKKVNQKLNIVDTSVISYRNIAKKIKFLLFFKKLIESVLSIIHITNKNNRNNYKALIKILYTINNKIIINAKNKNSSLSFYNKILGLKIYNNSNLVYKNFIFELKKINDFE